MLSGMSFAGFFAMPARLATFSRPVKPIIAIGMANASALQVGLTPRSTSARQGVPVEQERQAEHRHARLDDQVEQRDGDTHGVHVAAPDQPDDRDRQHDGHRQRRRLVRRDRSLAAERPGHVVRDEQRRQGDPDQVVEDRRPARR